MTNCGRIPSRTALPVAASVWLNMKICITIAQLRRISEYILVIGPFLPNFRRQLPAPYTCREHPKNLVIPPRLGNYSYFALNCNIISAASVTSVVVLDNTYILQSQPKSVILFNFRSFSLSLPCKFRITPSN